MPDSNPLWLSGWPFLPSKAMSLLSLVSTLLILSLDLLFLSFFLSLSFQLSLSVFLQVKRKHKTTTTTTKPKYLVFINIKGIYTIRHENFPLVLLHTPTSLPCFYWDDWLDPSVIQPMSLPKGCPAIPLALPPQNIIWLRWGFSKLSCSDLYLLGSSFPNLPPFYHILP